MLGFGDAPDKSACMSFLLGTSKLQFNVGDVFVVTNLNIGVYSGQSVFKLTASTGFFESDATWSEWKKEFAVEKFLAPLVISRPANLLREVVYHFELSGKDANGRIIVRTVAFLTDFTGTMTRRVCDECKGKWNEEKKCCDSGKHVNALPVYVYMLNVEITDDKEGSDANTLKNGVMMFNEVAMQLFRMSAAQFQSMGMDDKTNMFNEFFGKRYEMCIQVVSAKNMFPKLTMKSIKLQPEVV